MALVSVVAPVTVKLPVVDTVKVPSVINNTALIVELPLLNVKAEVPTLKVTFVATNGPPETVTPAPAPIVNVPAGFDKPPAPVKFMATVGVIVPVPNVAVGQVKVDPAALVNPPLKTRLAVVVTEVDVNVPLLVTKPVNVVIPVFVTVKPCPALTPNAPANAIFVDPAIVRVPAVTVTAPANAVKAALAVTL